MKNNNNNKKQAKKNGLADLHQLLPTPATPDPNSNPDVPAPKLEGDWMLILYAGVEHPVKILEKRNEGYLLERNIFDSIPGKKGFVFFSDMKRCPDKFRLIRAEEAYEKSRQLQALRTLNKQLEASSNRWEATRGGFGFGANNPYPGEIDTSLDSITTSADDGMWRK